MVSRDGKEILPTPAWVLIVRVFQFIFSLIVIGCAGWFVHGLWRDSLGFAIVCSLFTWVIVVYAVLSEKVAGCHRAYNTWAHLALDGLMILFWLSAMGAVASTRAAFRYNVNISGCSSDGSAVNSNTCSVYKRADAPGVASAAALSVLSATAGMCAIMMFLFAASFAYVCHMFRVSFPAKSADPEKPAAGTELTSGVTHTQQFMHPQQQQPAGQGYPAQPQQPPKWAEGQASYPQQPPTYPQNQPYDPYTQQNTGHAAPGVVHSPEQYGQPQPQVPYQTQGSPAPGQQYHQPGY